MELWSRTVALYGRFSPGTREALAKEIGRRGGRVERDLTRHCRFLVIGERADSLIASGTLLRRLEFARVKGKPVFSEARFQEALLDSPTVAPVSLVLATALASTGATDEEACLLAAFDLITVRDGMCAFGDAATLKTASSLREAGCTPATLISTLRQARRAAPKGRHKAVVAPNGEAALKWDDGLTTLDGQGFLPLDLSGSNVDDLFEAAVLAEAEGRLEDAIRTFDMCARVDRTDAISIFNLANIHLRQENWEAAALAYRRALARDADLVEARYNLAQALEASGRLDAAALELDSLLNADPEHADALFNLAQLRMNAEQLDQAKALYERYLRTEPPADWETKARKAIAYCSRSA